MASETRLDLFEKEWKSGQLPVSGEDVVPDLIAVARAAQKVSRYNIETEGVFASLLGKLDIALASLEENV